MLVGALPLPTTMTTHDDGCDNDNDYDYDHGDVAGVG